MSAVAERLKQVTLKIGRAKSHLEDLERFVRAFLDSNPYRVGTKHDRQSRKLVYYVTDVKPIPDNLALVAGDIIHNLMSLGSSRVSRCSKRSINSKRVSRGSLSPLRRAHP